MDIFSSILLVLIAFFPLYLWGYMASRMTGEGLLRARFWGGMFAGALSVGMVALITHFEGSMNVIFYGCIFGFFIILLALVVCFSLFGSRIARIYIRKIGIFHMILMLVMSALLMILMFSGIENIRFFLLLFPIFFAAFFEETAKHMMTLGLLGKEFQFSRRDLAYFTFFVVLGFVFFENLLYFFTKNISITEIILRSILPLGAHLLSALLCTMFWWRALSYPLFSWKYAGFFLLGLVVAVSVHTAYNACLEAGWMIMGLGFFLAAYGVFIYLSENPEKSSS